MGTEEQERRLSSSPVNRCPTAWSSRYRTARCGSRHSSLGVLPWEVVNGAEVVEASGMMWGDTLASLTGGLHDPR